MKTPAAFFVSLDAWSWLSASTGAPLLPRMMPYERFEAWKVCDELAVQVYEVTKSFPKYELYGMTSQARRASFSAPVNMAEGTWCKRVLPFSEHCHRLAIRAVLHTALLSKSRIAE